jgi:succinate dehydrogenase flavin-adding protein (antitoxin of CptAB toxin-antitoxin module)
MRKLLSFLVLTSLITADTPLPVKLSKEQLQEAVDCICEDDKYNFLQEYARKVQGEEKQEFQNILELCEQELVNLIGNSFIAHAGKIGVASLVTGIILIFTMNRCPPWLYFGEIIVVVTSAALYGLGEDSVKELERVRFIKSLL